MKLRGRYKKIAAMLALSAVMITTQVQGAMAAENESAEDLEQKKQDTLDEIKNLKNSISKVKSEIDDLEDSKSSVQNYISTLDKKANSLQAEITEFEKKIEEKKEEIENTEKELEAAQEQADAQYEAMKKRIQFMYENQGSSILEMLLVSENMTELLNRVDYISSMTNYDKEMMDKLQEALDLIAEYKSSLEEEEEELEAMQTAVAQEKKNVESTISNKKNELASYNSDLSEAAENQDDYEKELEEQEKLLNQIEEQIAKAANGNAYEGTTTGFIWPCPSYSRISSYFGPRDQPTAGASTYHKGVDLAAPYGASILASAAGKVTTSAYSSSAGNYIVISHGNGVSTAYMHCSRLLVSVGDTVEQGAKIAEVGSTGYSTGNHLHFSVIVNGSYVNPLGYVSP